MHERINQSKSDSAFDLFNNGAKSRQCSSSKMLNSSSKMVKCTKSRELALKIDGKRKVDAKERSSASSKKLRRSDLESGEGLRRSSRFSASKSVLADEIEVELGENASLKLVKSEMKSPSLVMAEKLGEFDEDMVLRRSPRCLPSSLAINDECDELELRSYSKRAKKKKVVQKVEPKEAKEKSKVKQNKEICFFIGEPVPEEEAIQKWGWRYQLKVIKLSSFFFVALAFACLYFKYTCVILNLPF